MVKQETEVTICTKAEELVESLKTALGGFVGESENASANDKDLANGHKSGAVLATKILFGELNSFEHENSVTEGQMSLFDCRQRKTVLPLASGKPSQKRFRFRKQPVFRYRNCRISFESVKE